jgi:hypothetical protein
MVFFFGVFRLRGGGSSDSSSEAELAGTEVVSSTLRRFAVGLASINHQKKNEFRRIKQNLGESVKRPGKEFAEPRTKEVDNNGLTNGELGFTNEVGLTKVVVGFIIGGKYTEYSICC